MGKNADNKNIKKENKKEKIKKEIAKSYKMGTKYYEEIEKAEK